MNKINRWKKELTYLAGILDQFQLEKKVKWGSDVYIWGGRNILSFAGFKNFFTLWFFNGVFINDKYNVLINAQEGKTKSLRQWRFTSFEEIDVEKIKYYVQEAIRVEKQGLRIAPESAKETEMPDELIKVLSKNKRLKSAFEKLTPSCKNEYIKYIAEAKQTATRERRIEKISPMILEKLKKKTVVKSK